MSGSDQKPGNTHYFYILKKYYIVLCFKHFANFPGTTFGKTGELQKRNNTRKLVNILHNICNIFEKKYKIFENFDLKNIIVNYLKYWQHI